MTQLNPDFRGADEVVVPPNGLMGWTDGKTEEREAISREQRGADRLMADMPVAFNARPPEEPVPALLASWNAFQKSKGRFDGSFDWTLLDEWIHKEPLLFLPQIIGSCVESNTNPALVCREMYQVGLLGQASEYLGRKEFGPSNYASYGPFSYGMARRRANMRGSDGLYCEPMLESLMKDGRIPCNTPKLLEILNARGLAREQDFPEPQGNAGAQLYRDFGNWKHLDELMPFADNLVTEGSYVTDISQLLEGFEQGKVAFVCSSEAIKKVGTHPDGFAIHAVDTRNKWYHNMSLRGKFVASDGEQFIREANESWGKEHIYNRRVDEVAAAIRTRKLTIALIGNINMRKSSVPQI